MNTALVVLNKRKALASHRAENAPGTSLQRKCAYGGSAGSAGDFPAIEKKKLPLRRSAAGSEGRATAPPIVHEVLGSPGQPLDQATRASMEPRFGHDFGKVRLHTDAKAAESARSVNAHAYAVGNQIAFASGKYAPNSGPGKRLLAHELAHVVQQSGSAGEPGVARSAADASLPIPIASDLASERAADSAANAVVKGSGAIQVGGSPGGLARDSAGPVPTPKPAPAPTPAPAPAPAPAPCGLPIRLGLGRHDCGDKTNTDFRHDDHPGLSAASTAQLAAWAYAHGRGPFRSLVTDIECEAEMAGALALGAGASGTKAFSRFKAGTGGTETLGPSDPLSKSALAANSFKVTVAAVKKDIESQLATQAASGALNVCALKVVPPATSFRTSGALKLNAVIGGTHGEWLNATAFTGDVSKRTYSIDLEFVICDNFGVDEHDIYPLPGLYGFWVLQHERDPVKYAPFMNELHLPVTVSGTF